jgi:DNA replication protein DnaC
VSARAAESAALSARLEERSSKSLVVAGPVGVGKTMLRRALFRRISLAGYPVLGTSTGRMISGMTQIGERRRTRSGSHDWISP